MKIISKSSLTKEIINCIGLSLFFIIGIKLSTAINAKLITLFITLIFLCCLTIFLKGKLVLSLILMILFDSCFFNIMPRMISFAGISFELSKLSIVIVAIIYFNWILDKINGKKMKRIDRSNYIFLFIIILVSISTIYTYLKINQPIILSIAIQSEFLALLVIIPISQLIKDEKVEFEQITKAIMYMAILASILWIIQFVLYDYVVFLNVGVTERYGGLRLHFQSNILIYALIIAIVRFIHTKKKKYILYSLLYLLCLLLVVKARMTLFGVLLGVFTILLFSKKINKLVFIYIFIAGAIVINLANVKFINDIIDLTIKEVTSSSGNYLVREMEKEFYKSQVENPVIGRGVVSPKTPQGKLLDGEEKYYYISDVGITGFYTMYGIIGVVWYLVIIIITFIKSIRNKSSNICYEGVAYSIYLLVVISTLAIIYFSPINLILTFYLLSLNEKENDKYILGNS